MGGAESNPGGAKFDLTRMRTLPAGAGGEVVRSTALPGLPSLCPLVTFNDEEDEDEEASGSGGGTAVMLVVDDISCPTDIPGDAVCARGGGGGGGGVFGASPSAYKSCMSFTMTLNRQDKQVPSY